jgi:hypothetical protein
MTTKQAERIGKALLPGMHGFVATGKMVFKSPVDDFLRGLYFGTTSDANYFHFWVFLLPLFVPNEGISFNFGGRIGNALNWRLDNPNLSADLKSTIENEAIPFLDKVSTLAGVIKYLQALIERDRQRVDLYALQALACSFIKDERFPAALNVLGEQKRRLQAATTSWTLELRARAELLERMLLEDPNMALAQLDTWKAETKRTLKLEA